MFCYAVVDVVCTLLTWVALRSVCTCTWSRGMLPPMPRPPFQGRACASYNTERSCRMVCAHVPTHVCAHTWGEATCCARRTGRPSREGGWDFREIHTHIHLHTYIYVLFHTYILINCSYCFISLDYIVHLSIGTLTFEHIHTCVLVPTPHIYM